MENNKIRVAITHGDTNGVGYELIFKTFAEPEMLELCTPIIYGSPKIAAYHRKALNIQANFTIINDAREAHEGKLNLLPCFDEEVKVDMGCPTPESGVAALKALDRAMTDYRDGAFDVLVSCPLSADNIHDDNFSFPGLPKYIETSVGEGSKAVTLMLSERMRIAVMAAGVDIKNVPAALTADTLVAQAKALHRSARRDFRLSNPRIALLALNSDADGDEEANTIRPAITLMEEAGICAFGPYPAEDFFGSDHYDAFDMTLAMYDDQATVPFRSLEPDGGICYIANLPLVCTAPMLTPQFEQAGQGRADESSFRNAVYAAIDIFRHRAEYDEPMGNPLPKLYHERRDESEKVRFSIPKKHDAAFKPAREGRGRDNSARRPVKGQAAAEKGGEAPVKGSEAPVKEAEVEMKLAEATVKIAEVEVKVAEAPAQPQAPATGNAEA